MFKNLKIILILILVSFTLSSAQQLPIHPMKQNIGIPDTIFNNLNKLNCAYCHKPELGWTFTPPTVKDGILADRHHLKVIKNMIIGENTQAPFGAPGEPYKCTSCHQIKQDAADGANKISDNFKNCLNCHIQKSGASVHHLTAKAQELDCKHCHSNRVDNPNDGHYIPTYRASMITPRPSGGTGPNGRGACNYCHSAGVDSVSGILVKSNKETHHSTGIGQEGISNLDCTLCHDNSDPALAIRRCQNCHGVKSLHSIQVDSDGDGFIKASEEKPYFGHVGNNQDCEGCHSGWDYEQNALSKAYIIVPQLNDISTFKISNEKTTILTIKGQAFTNIYSSPKKGTINLKSTIILTKGSNNKEIKLTPSFISESSLKVTIPKGLTPGNYYIRADKYSIVSNPLNLVILPAVSISKITNSGNKFTILGNGFGKYLDASDSQVYLTIANSRCNIESWSDEKIIATCNNTCKTLKVKSIFGDATKNITCGNGGNNDYDVGFAQGKSDSCAWKTWSIPEAYQGNDTYVKAYDEGWENCDRSNPPVNDEDRKKGLNQGKADACAWKTWSIPEIYQGNDTYVKAYDEGWESCDRNNPPVNNEDKDKGFKQGKADSCAWKTWSIPDAYIGNTTYTKAYDKGWESCR